MSAEPNSYPGGKAGAGIYQRQINLIPPHEVFISGFLGNCAVMRMKKAALINIGIDKSSHCVSMMQELMEARQMPFIGHVGCFLDWWENVDGSTKFGRETSLYLDPPYLNCDTPQRYKHKAAIEIHVALLKRISDARCNVMICGYPSRLYERMLEGWRKVEYQAWTRGAKFKTECIWMNYPEPRKLHDYSFLGSNFRERERIKKRRERWINKFSALQEIEKRAILEELTKCLIFDDEKKQKKLTDLL